jgi:hypothetical protein
MNFTVAKVNTTMKDSKFPKILFIYIYILQLKKYDNIYWLFNVLKKISQNCCFFRF